VLAAATLGLAGCSSSSSTPARPRVAAARTAS